jgi:hypothetical protein
VNLQYPHGRQDELVEKDLVRHCKARPAAATTGAATGIRSPTDTTGTERRGASIQALAQYLELRQLTRGLLLRHSCCQIEGCLYVGYQLRGRVVGLGRGNLDTFAVDHGSRTGSRASAELLQERRERWIVLPEPAQHVLHGLWSRSVTATTQTRHHLGDDRVAGGALSGSQHLK